MDAGPTPAAVKQRVLGPPGDREEPGTTGIHRRSVNLFGFSSGLPATRAVIGQ